MSDKDEGLPAIAEESRTGSVFRLGPVGVAVAAVFGLFYAYALWSAISRIVELPTLFARHGVAASLVPWWLGVLGILLPLAAFAAALVLGRRRNLLGRALIFLLGLTVVAALGFSLIGFEDSVLANAMLDNAVRSLGG